jgi:hypothetical protein
LPNKTLLPPLPFLPASTVYSACCPTGLLRPAASHGVRVVSSPVSHHPHYCDCWSPVPFPHSHLTPSEAFPSTSSRSVSPHSFPSRRCSRLLFPTLAHSTSRPFSTVESVAIHQYFYRLWPDTPLGFVPLQGSPLILECSLEKLRKSSAKTDSFWATSAKADAPWIASTKMPAEHEQTCSSQRSYSKCCLPRQDVHQGASSRRPADILSACP